MKRLAIIVVLSMIQIATPGQMPVPVDSLYTFIKFNSIHRTTADWNHIDSTFNDQIQNATSLDDTMKCFVTVLKSLNDVHSQILLYNRRYYGHYPVFDDTLLARLKPLNDRAISETNTILTRKIKKGIGYIRVPAVQVFDTQQLNKFAQSLADNVSDLSKRCRKGLIVDLRLNGGGNIYPMISGLSQLLGNGIVGYETDIDDAIVRAWKIRNGNFIIGGYQTTDINVKSSPEANSIPIAVLIGPVTKSAGSMFAIAFKGRPNTHFIGEPTADGYTTSNGYFQFNANLILNFATNYVADRNENIYKTTVNPDLVIQHGDNFDDLTRDEKIKAAIRWLNER